MQDNNELIKKSGEHFKDNINFLFIAKENLIIVTKDDKVYQIDGQLNKTYSSIAYSSDEYVVKELIEKSIVEELCDKNVVDIKGGKKHTTARTSHGKVYIWGLNDYGVLGNGFNDKKIYRPQLNQYMNGLYIIDMSCGAKHTLVLTSSGNIYGWGWNKFGQIGCGSHCEYQLIPFNMNGLISEKFKAISCGAYHSMALTKDGRVFCCGYNAFGQLGDRSLTDSHKLKLIHMNNIIIEKISCGFSHSILLSNKEEIYVLGNYYNNELDIKESEPQKLYSYKFCDIATHWSQDFFSALSVNQIYYIWGQFELKGGIEYEPKQTTYKSFNEIFINYWQITYQSIEGISSQSENDSIANKKLLQIKRESHNSNEFDCKADKFMNFGEKFIRNGYYERNFDEKQKIGEGSYGQVFEVSFKNQVNVSFAIKKITFRFDYMEKMFETLGVYDSVSKLKNKNIVSTKDFWFEKDMFDEKIMIFYILMELCMLNLSGFIDQVGDANFSSYLKYHLSHVIFIQSLRGVNYLHKQNPPIIHRDLNPCNILLKLEQNKRVSVKIADFQSVTIHKYAEQLHELDVGNIEYMAPEVENSGKYDTKADIYSLGKVLRDLFDINSDDKYDYCFDYSSKFFLILICLIEAMFQQI
jgi:alpha-tubulin suppressor-like RCC1 family protein